MAFKMIAKKVDEDGWKFQKIQISEDGHYVMLNSAAFGNCQNLIIGYFNNFVNHFKQTELAEKLLQLKDSTGHADKPILTVDIRSNVYDRFKDYLPIRNITPYKSTNGSNMVLVQIDFSRVGLMRWKVKIENQVKEKAKAT